ncbi:hypothetical protein F5Y16DRAFT_123661 [Xylariaceae sp. FL0255]|nr:hypothetical protein F5Y16DRAFT_123661 [Xylariaceae sp. FL0255]
MSSMPSAPYLTAPDQPQAAPALAFPRLPGISNGAAARRQARTLRAQAEARRIRTQFKKHEWFEFVKFVANGVSGFSCLMKLNFPKWHFWRQPQQFVFKRAVDVKTDQALKRENRALRRLRGSLHILQKFPLKKKWHFPLYSDGRPIIVTEWVPHGPLAAFRDRAIASGRSLPNRLLLRFFLCLLKFCIAMAWPPRGARGATPRTEKVPTSPIERALQTQFRHADMHLNNILIGALDASEHSNVPILKLIDFDRAHDVSGPLGHDLGVKWNIHDIGRIMRILIALRPGVAFGGAPVGGKDMMLRINGINRVTNTKASDLTWPNYPDLDPDLASLVMWCMATDEADRPTIIELNASLTNLIADATPDKYATYPSGGKYETDDEIKKLVQEIVLNVPAPVPDPPLTSSSAPRPRPGPFEASASSS